MSKTTLADRSIKVAPFNRVYDMWPFGPLVFGFVEHLWKFWWKSGVQVVLVCLEIKCITLGQGHNTPLGYKNICEKLQTKIITSSWQPILRLDRSLTNWGKLHCFEANCGKLYYKGKYLIIFSSNVQNISGTWSWHVCLLRLGKKDILHWEWGQISP